MQKLATIIDNCHVLAQGGMVLSFIKLYPFEKKQAHLIYHPFDDTALVSTTPELQL
jgi:hypothetical protein